MATERNFPETDPTANVYKWVEGAVTRLDDLRSMQISYEEKIRSIESKWMESKDYAQSLQNNALEKRVAEMERMQYENKGKDTITDPKLEKMDTKLDALLKSRSLDKGEDTGRKNLWMLLSGAVMMVIGILSLIFTIVNNIGGG